MSPQRISTNDASAFGAASMCAALSVAVLILIPALCGVAAAQSTAPAARQHWLDAMPEGAWPWIGGLLVASIVLVGAVAIIAARRPERSARRATQQLAPVDWPEAPLAEPKPAPVAHGVGRWLLIGWDREGRSMRLRFGPLDLARAGDGIVLGRNAELCHFVVGNTSVSRRHLRFSLLEGELRVEDMNTTNGTYLDGRKLAPLKPVRLASGQSMVLGDFHLRFMDQGQP